MRPAMRCERCGDRIEAAVGDTFVDVARSLEGCSWRWGIVDGKWRHDCGGRINAMSGRREADEINGSDRSEKRKRVTWRKSTGDVEVLSDG